MIVSVSVLACLAVTGAGAFCAVADFALLAVGVDVAALGAVCAGAGADVVAGAFCVVSGFGCGLGANFDMNCWLTMMATKVRAKTRSNRRKSFGSWFGL